VTASADDRCQWRSGASGAGQPLTLPAAILAAASARPDLPVSFCSAARTETVSRADLVDRAARCAAAFRGLGIEAGDSVAVQVPSRIVGPLGDGHFVSRGDQ